MTQSAWFGPEHAPLFSFVALVSLMYLLEAPAERGRYRIAILSACAAVIAGGLGMLLAAAHALSEAQPSYVISTLLACGSLLMLVSLPAFIRLIGLYRRDASKDLGAQAPRQPFSWWQ